MKNIKYKLGLYFSDRMYDDRDISFNILLPIQFDTEEEAIASNSCFIAKLEYLDKEVVINIYEKNIDFSRNDFKMDYELIKTIHWQNYYAYTCSITKEDSVGKLCSDPFFDEEPCSEKFELILKNLTFKKSFLLQNLSYWVEPIFAEINN